MREGSLEYLLNYWNSATSPNFTQFRSVQILGNLSNSCISVSSPKSSEFCQKSTDFSQKCPESLLTHKILYKIFRIHWILGNFQILEFIIEFPVLIILVYIEFSQQFSNRLKFKDRILKSPQSEGGGGVIDYAWKFIFVKTFLRLIRILQWLLIFTETLRL